MLSIKPIGSSAAEVRYYATLGREDYYVNGGEPQGTWWGRGAAAIGLAGTVEREDLGNVLQGYAPGDRTNLVQNAGDPNRRSAFDLTWSVPKSVSVAWSQSPLSKRKEIEAAAERSLQRTLSVFEELCGVTRRGHAGERVERAGLVAAIFRHNTARGMPGEAPDPNLHWHVVLGNAVVRDDESTGAFDARPLFKPQMKMTLGALFRTELSKELEALGLSSHRPVRPTGRQASWFELDAVPDDLVREFSKRRREIEKWLREHGAGGAKAAERAALQTRHKKEHFTREELFSAWRDVAAQHSFDWEKLKPYFERRQVTINERDQAKAAVTAAVKRITDDRAHFSKLELTRFAAEEAQGRGVGIGAVRDAVSSRLAAPEIVKLSHIDGDRHFTTKEMLALEERMLASARTLRSQRTDCSVSPSVISSVLKRHSKLRAEQAEAVRHATATGNVKCVVGMAGTGKTFMLSVAREAWEKSGLSVLGTALSAKAADGLEQGSGISSVHIHNLLRALETGKRKLTSNTVLVVDEAGMIGTRTMERLTSLALASGAKLVLVGDDRQLQAIDAGAPFRGIAERVGHVSLTEIIRQRDRWARDAVGEFSRGEAHSALGRFAERGLLRIAPDRETAVQELVSDWKTSLAKANIQETLIFAGTNLETVNVNRLCQAARMRAGELGESCVMVGGESIHAGERVMFTRNNPALCVKNGQLGTVTSVSLDERTIRVRIDGGFSVAVDVSTFEHVKLGYAVTTHKGQGVTVENSFILTGQMTDREMTYVQSSRARGVTRLYTDLLSGGEDVARLANQMSRSHAKDLAHDYLLEGT